MSLSFEIAQKYGILVLALKFELLPKVGNKKPDCLFTLGSG